MRRTSRDILPHEPITVDDNTIGFILDMLIELQDLAVAGQDHALAAAIEAAALQAHRAVSRRRTRFQG